MKKRKTLSNDRERVIGQKKRKTSWWLKCTRILIDLNSTLKGQKTTPTRV